MEKNGVVVANTGIYDVTTSGSYSVKIIDNTCQSTSFASFLFGNNVPVQISSASDTIEVCNGSSATLYISANNVAGNFTQWYRDGVLISPQPQNVFLSSFTTPTGGNYTVKLTEGSCSSISNPVYLKTVSSFSKPTFSVNTENTTCVISPTYTANTSFSFNGQIRWLNNGVEISGAFLTSYSPTASGTYSLKITQGSCQGISDPITFTSVSDNPPYIIEAKPIFCSTGYTLSLKYSRSSYSFVQYQWFKDGVAISGATSATYNASVSGTYKVRISMLISSCVGFSQDLAVTVNTEMGKANIVSNNVNGGISKSYQCANNLVRLTVPITSSNFNFNNLQWKRDGIIVPNPSGITNYLYITQSGVYSFFYSSGTCPFESNNIKINIGDKQQSLKTNNWNDQSTWACGTVPTITDEVLINKGHTVSLPDNFTGFLKNLELNGILNKGTNAQLKFQTN